MTDYVSIHEKVGAYVVELLESAMIFTGHHAETMPHEIRQGQLQANPVDGNGIRVLVNPGDLDDTKSSSWIDELATKTSVPGWELPSLEIGGGSFYVRRFTVDVSVFFVKSKENRELARQIGTYVINRAESTLRENPFPPNLVDTFGETAIGLQVSKSYPIEGGGPPNSFIWRGKIFFQVITEKP